MIRIDWRALLGLPTRHIYAVANKETKAVCSIINPTYESEMWDDCWTKNDPKFVLLKLPRNHPEHRFDTSMSFRDCAIAQKLFEEML